MVSRIGHGFACKGLLVFMSLPIFQANLATFKMCGVRDTKNYFYNGWFHVIDYVNNKLGGLSIEGQKILIEKNDTAFDFSASQDATTDWYRLWAEMVGWGCQAALVQTDVADFRETAAVLEGQGLIVMLASGGRWTTNPNTGNFWTSVWNGAISSALYTSGFIANAAFEGATSACAIYRKGWGFGTAMTLSVEAEAKQKYDMDVIRVEYNHSNSRAEVQNGEFATWACEVNNVAGCEATFVEPYDLSAWAYVMDACQGREILVAYTLMDGMSLARYIWENKYHFKAIFMSNAPYRAEFGALTGEAGELVITPSQWDPGMATSCEVFGDNANFTASFEASYGRPPMYMEALTAFDAVAVVLGAQTMNSVSTLQVNAGIKTLDNRETFFGRVQWGLNNMQGRDPLLLQIQHRNLTVVDPKDVAVAKNAYPIPTIQARIGCPAGFYNGPTITIKGKTNVTECMPCSEGRYSEVPGLVSPIGCLRCAIGTYADTSGVSACKDCPISNGFAMTTPFEAAASESDCRCKDGLYLTASEKHCAECPKGMSCTFGSSMENYRLSKQPYPTLQPHYWSSTSDPLSIFKCSTADSCPGGDPGTCGQHFVDQACGRCANGYTLAGTTCLKCSDWEMSKFAFPVIPLVVVPMIILGVYRISRDAVQKWGSAQNGSMAVNFVLLNHFQILALMGSVSIERPDSLEGWTGAWTWTTDLMSMFNVKCAGLEDIEKKMYGKVSGPLYVGLVAIIVYGTSQIIGRSLKKTEVRLNHNRMCNVFFSLVYTFFNAIVALSLLIVTCIKHPNGVWTLSSDLTVTCFEDGSWTRMVVLGVFAIVLYILGFGSLFTWAIIVAPSRFSSDDFRTRWKFLFLKYRPEVLWWSSVFLMKNTLVNLVLVVFSHAVWQMYCIMTVVLMYTGLVLAFLPYRHRAANIHEVIAGMSVSYYASISTWFIDQDNDSQNSSLGIFCTVVNVAPVVTGLGAVAYLAVTGLLRQDFPNSLARQYLIPDDEKSKAVKAAKLFVMLENDKEASDIFWEHIGEYGRMNFHEMTVLVESELIGAKGTKRVNDGVMSDKLTPEFSQTLTSTWLRNSQPNPKANTEICDVQYLDQDKLVASSVTADDASRIAELEAQAIFFQNKAQLESEMVDAIVEAALLDLQPTLSRRIANPISLTPRK